MRTQIFMKHAWAIYNPLGICLFSLNIHSLQTECGLFQNGLFRTHIKHPSSFYDTIFFSFQKPELASFFTFYPSITMYTIFVHSGSTNLITRWQYFCLFKRQALIYIYHPAAAVDVRDVTVGTLRSVFFGKSWTESKREGKRDRERWLLAQENERKQKKRVNLR